LGNISLSEIDNQGKTGGVYIFRNRHRFFDQDSIVDNDISRRSQVEDGSRYDPLARCDHAYPDSADQSLAGLIWPKRNARHFAEATHVSSGNGASSLKAWGIAPGLGTEFFKKR
jgi:hypothetical protein